MCDHKFVIGPDGRGLYARCLKCNDTYHALTLGLLKEIGAIREEDGQLKFTIDPNAERFLKIDPEQVSS